MQITEHFTLAELCHSDTAVRLGIDNTPGQLARDNLVTLAYGLEAIRAALGGHPLHISSAYRCPELNRAVGSTAKNSAHLIGLAADFTCPGFGTPRQVAEHLAGLVDSLCFDQLIEEAGRWVHVGYAGYACTPRKEILTARFSNGMATYTKGLT